PASATSATTRQPSGDAASATTSCPRPPAHHRPGHVLPRRPRPPRPPGGVPPTGLPHAQRPLRRRPRLRALGAAGGTRPLPGGTPYLPHRAGRLLRTPSAG